MKSELYSGAGVLKSLTMLFFKPKSLTISVRVSTL